MNVKSLTIIKTDCIPKESWRRSVPLGEGVINPTICIKKHKKLCC